MVSWSGEAASFRELVTSKAGLGFVLSAGVANGYIVALARESAEATSIFAWLAFGAFILSFGFAYYLRREALMWVVTRLPVASLAITFGVTVIAIVFGAEVSTDAYLEETVFGLIVFSGGALLFAAIPVTVAFVALMAVHGASGRSEGPDAFPKE